MHLLGFHHLTAVSADVRGNHAFYTGTLGMRLVKRSVNQDDVSAYHLFYSDAVGSPGNDLTFFDWAVPGERRGTRSVVQTGLRVAGAEALQWWAAWLAERGVPVSHVAEVDGRLRLEFEDPEGQRLALVDDGGTGDATVPWERSPVPAEHQVRGLGPITMSVPDLRPTDLMLTRVLGMHHAREYTRDGRAVHVYAMTDDPGAGPHAELHVAVEPDVPAARAGAGGVHHVAFRTPDEAQYHAWAERLSRFGLAHSGEVDRYYFRSLYVREPNGVLFEIATDGPGFAVDEPAEALGERLALPPFLEGRRQQIEAGLKPID